MATLTLTINDADVPRLRAAFGLLLGLTNAQGQNRPATAAEVTDWLRGQLKRVVETQERQAEEQKIAVPELTVT